MAHIPNVWKPEDVITSSKLNDLENGLATTSENTVYGMGGAQQSSDGIHSLSYINKGDALPSKPQVGDTIFQKDGDDFQILEWNGEEWVERINPDLSNRIDKVLSDANENAEKVVNENTQKINDTIDEVTKEQIELALKDADFNKNAQELADKALADAKANTAQVAQDTLNSANKNLNDAKTSLTSDLQKEISDRDSAVSALDTKSQGYADQAKQDAINAATTADGTINKKIDETASSLTLTINQNKTDANGKINTAQSTATQALNGLTTKVSQTDYDKKTGDLSTQINTTSQTATQSKQDIADIKTKDGQQDSRMNTIESDASGTKQTVSQLQTVQGQQSGSISTLQQRADGFDATVAKVNNLSTGDRNYVLDTVNPKKQVSNGKDNQNMYNSAIFYEPIKNWGVANGDYIISFDWTLTTALSEDMSAGVFFNQSPWQQQIYTVKAGQIKGHVICKLKLMPSILTATTDVVGLNFRIHHQMASGNAITYSNLFMKSGTLDTSWTPAPEDVDSATAKAQLTADQATTALSNYKTDADGRITKAQSDIIQTAKDVTTKVSQSDYNSKTSELTTKVSTAQQTADSAVTTIGSYKTSNDNRVSSAESKISQNTTAINLRATKTDLDNAKSDYTAKISQINIDTNGISQNVSSIQNSINDLQQVNLLKNTEFNPDYASWVPNNNSGSLFIDNFWKHGSSNNLGLIRNNGATNWLHVVQNIPLTKNQVISFSVLGKVNTAYDGALYLHVRAYDQTNKSLGDLYKITQSQTNNFQTFKSENMTLPDNTAYVQVALGMYKNASVAFAQPILVVGNKVGNYVVGAYSDSEKISAQQITIDGITNTVSNQGDSINSLSTRVQTAEGNISTATNNISGLQSKQTQTANQISQEITDRTNGDSNTLQSSKDFTTSSITGYDKGVQTQITQTSDAILAKVGATNLFPNSEFAQAYGYTASGTVVRSGSVKNNIDNKYNGTVSVTSTSAGYQGYWTEMIPVYGGKKYSASVLVHYTNGGLSNGSAMLDIWFYDKDNKKISSGSRATGQVSSPYWVKLSNEGFTAPINAVKVQVSLLVNNAGTGQVATFTQPIVTATEKLQEYTPNDDVSSQLSLLKNNWSIGIADNIGKISNGIAADSTSMNIISNKVVISAPETQITGTAWINSAMIKNASIQTINIADAAITTAKIAQLDVAKLTGNVSSFIQSNWNGSFGSTTIDSTGMEVKTGLAKTKFTDGNMQLVSSLGENIGYIGRQVDSVHTNLDYLTFGLNGYRTTRPGDDHYDGGSDFYGGDGILFGISNADGGYSPLLQWNSQLAANYRSAKSGWLFTQPIIGETTFYPNDMSSDSDGLVLKHMTIDGISYPTYSSTSSQGSSGLAVGLGTSNLYAGTTRVLQANSNGYMYYLTGKTTGAGVNLKIVSDGAIAAQSSATKYKSDIEYEYDTSHGDKLLTIDPATWYDAEQKKQIEEYNRTGKEPDYSMNKDGDRYYGMIAEDLVKAGLEDLVVRDANTGSIEGIQYEKIGIALIPILREQRNQINELKVEVERLKVNNE